MRARMFSRLAGFIIARPWKIVAVAVALSAISGIYAAGTIRLNANLDDLVSEKLDYHRRYIEFLKEFGDEEYMYVVVDAEGDLPRAKKFLDALGAKIKDIPDIKQAIWKIENPALEKNFLLYLSPAELKALAAMTSGGPFAVKNIASWDGLAPLFGALASRIGGPVSTADEKELATGFTFIDGLIDDMTLAIEKGGALHQTVQGGAPHQTVQGGAPHQTVQGGAYRSRLQALFFGGAETFDTDGFLKNGGLLFMLIMPAKDFQTMEVISKPLSVLRQTIEDTRREFPGIDAGLTGRPVLSADEMSTSNTDMTRATILAIVIEALLLFLFFRNASRPLFSITALVMGISWTFGFVAIIYGTLNILSMVFAIILASTAIEYSIQIVARYQEESSVSGDVNFAVRKSLTHAGKAVLTSALTTSAAFCTIMWTNFTALRQLGAIAALGIILCLIASLVVLPAMIVIWDRRRAVRELKKIHAFVMPGIERFYKRPKILFAVCMGATLVLGFFTVRTSFDSNLLNLQAEGLDSVRYERMIIEKSSETTWFARAVAETPAESRQKALEFAKLPSVRKVDDVERIVPEGQDEKIKLVRAMAPAFSGLTFRIVGEHVDARLLMFELGRLASNLEKLEAVAFTSGRADAVAELDAFAGKVRRLVEQIDRADEGQLKNLGKLQRDFFDDIQKNLLILAGGMKPSRISLGDLPEDMARRFVSPKGRYSLYIYPKDNIWDPPALARFTTDIRSVDPNVVGTPIEVHESGELMRETLKRSGLLAFAVICILVWLDFRSFRSSFLAIIPLVAGTIWLLGAMGLFGISFNMANFFAIPILIGIGIDFGVNVMHRIRQEKSFSAIGTSMGKGVLLTALANAAGFGTMMIARHRGVASLGEVMALGCILCFLASVAVLPPMAKWLNWGFSLHKPRNFVHGAHEDFSRSRKG